MMKANVLKIIFVYLLTLFMASPIWAECPPGKTPITMSTPSGIVKTLCVPDAALSGIENAAENSDGTIIPASCPNECWTAEELSVLNEKFKGGIYCLPGITVLDSTCFAEVDNEQRELLSLQYIANLDVVICYSPLKTQLTFPEAKACDALLNPYKRKE